METAALTRVAEALEEMHREIARLGERVAVLEAHAGVPVAEKLAESLSEELVTVIGAAIAAFLGKKAHVRQIRLLGSAAWRQQGRVTIQASHRR
jgi:methylmalonyl-CoA carboxyltransferase large subunit